MSRDYVKMKASHRIGIALVACLLAATSLEIDTTA